MSRRSGPGCRPGCSPIWRLRRRTSRCFTRQWRITDRDRVAGLAQALNDDKDGRQAFERLRSLVDEVRLTPVDGQLAVELRGDLAAILKISGSGIQATETAQKNALQIKMVAGAGFDRELSCQC